jgi:hypothetical protein
MKKKNEISDIIMKKYPDTYANGFINIDVFVNINRHILKYCSK